MSTTDPYAGPDVCAPNPEALAVNEAFAHHTEPAVVAAPVAETSVIETVREGSIADVLDWVGEDKDRAARALEAEEAGEKRKTLIGKLKHVIG